MNTHLLDRPLSPPPAEFLPPKLEMTREEFEAWHPENGIKYEWKQGRVIFGETRMQKAERAIVSNLMRAFTLTRAYHAGGALFTESDCFLEPRDGVRRPDLSYFTQAQIKEGLGDNNPVPAFVIEIISRHDRFEYHEEKLDDYFAAGVQVVWQIIPSNECVRVHAADRTVTDLHGAQECSAAPVIPDFKLAVEAIFRAPQ